MEQTQTAERAFISEALAERQGKRRMVANEGKLPCRTCGAATAGPPFARHGECAHRVVQARNNIKELGLPAAMRLALGTEDKTFVLAVYDEARERRAR